MIPSAIKRKRMRKAKRVKKMCDKMLKYLRKDKDVILPLSLKDRERLCQTLKHTSDQLETRNFIIRW